jgi:4-amino-4-deoxy-L-arabinose transferase-like glycosyltransferase
MAWAPFSRLTIWCTSKPTVPSPNPPIAPSAPPKFWQPAGLIETGDSQRAAGWVWPAVALVFLILLVIRITSPSDLMDNEQMRQASYIMDEVQNHHWLFQYDLSNEVSSKPPMFTWLAGPPTILIGRPEPWAMRGVAAIATALCVWLTAKTAKKYWGARAAFLSVAGYLMSTPTGRQIWLGRMDALFPLTIALGAFAAFRSWETGKGWLWFWLAGAAATLTKSPLGLIIAAAGLAAVLFRRKSEPKTPLRGRQWPGILLFVVITLGWFLASIWSMGTAVYHKLIIEELLPQSIDPSDAYPGARFYVSPILFMSIFFPWAVFTCFNCARIWFFPDPREGNRRMERFLACWLWIGMLPFCLAPHQRADLLFPLIVPAAILSGSQLAAWLEPFGNKIFAAFASVACVIGLGLLTYKYQVLARKKDYVQYTAYVAQFADEIQQKVGANFPITHVDDPFALSIDLNTARPFYYGPTRDTTGVFDDNMVMTYDYDAAAALLQSDGEVFLAVDRIDAIYKRVGRGVHVYQAAAISPQSAVRIYILSNRPTLAAEDHQVCGIGPLKIDTQGLRWIHASAVDFVFGGAGTASFTNNDTESRKIFVQINSKSWQTVTIPPQQTQIVH